MCGGGDRLNFHFDMCGGPKGSKRELPPSLGSDFLSTLKLLKLKLEMLGIKTEFFFNFEALKCKFFRNL